MAGRGPGIGTGNYGYNTGGRMVVTQPKPVARRVVTAPTTGYAPGGVPTAVPGRRPPPGISYKPIPPAQRVGPGGNPSKTLPGETPTPIYQGPNQIQLTAGYTPNYGAILKSDPGYLAAQQAATLAATNAELQRRSDIRQQYIAYGGDLAGWTDTYHDIDQTTRDLASQNQYSTLASMNRQQAIDQRTQAQQLAARGALESGDLAYGLDQLNTAYGQNRYNAAQSLGQQFNQDIGTYTGVLSTNAQNLAAGIQSAYSNAINNPAYRPRDPTYANYDPANSAKYKKPIFSAGNVLYTQDGQVFTG